MQPFGGCRTRMAALIQKLSSQNGMHVCAWRDSAARQVFVQHLGAVRTCGAIGRRTGLTIWPPRTRRSALVIDLAQKPQARMVSNDTIQIQSCGCRVATSLGILSSVV